MIMLKWINRNTRKDQIQYEEIRLKIRMTFVEENISESCLRWFGHVQRRVINELVRHSDFIQGNGKRHKKI